MRRLFFFWQYLFGKPPWDSGIAPPELVRVLTERGAMARREKRVQDSDDPNQYRASPTRPQAGPPAGNALDLGCGTGTNVRYLAERGWRATGIDFIPRAIEKAKRKTRGLAVTLLVGDVTKLESLPLNGPFDLALDIGCWHSLDEAGRGRYVAGLAHWMKPGGLFMLYAFQPNAASKQWGIQKDEVIAAFSSHFTLINYEQGQGRPSAWYYFARMADSR
jgi:SAM-dependent methyltransferase